MPTMTTSLPPKRSGETTRAYYGRLNKLRASLRGYLPELRDAAVQAGTDAGYTKQDIARRMDVSVAWLYTDRSTAGDYDPALLPKQRSTEDSLDYYVRLRELRDAIRAELPDMVVPAVREAEQESPAPTKTHVAVAMGVTESYLFKQLRKNRDD